MGKRDRERRERLIAGEKRMKQSAQPSAAERYRDLAAMNGCGEADESQTMMVLTMGADWGPIECPHCGNTPTICDLLKDRPSCEEIGHPEQSLKQAATGVPPVPCVLCGETPEFTDLDDDVANGPDDIAMSKLANAVEECGPNGHRRAARNYFFSAIADDPAPDPVPCRVCSMIPDLQADMTSDPPRIVETEPDGTVHLHVMMV